MLGENRYVLEFSRYQHFVRIVDNWGYTSWATLEEARDVINAFKRTAAKGGTFSDQDKLIVFSWIRDNLDHYICLN